jgi:hypothetical protein
LTDNPAFPDLPVSVADLTVASNAFRDSISAALGGGVILTALRNEARVRVIGLLRDESHYVQIMAKTSLPMLLSSGVTVINRNSAQTPLVRAAILKVLREQSTQLRLILKRIPNARSYQVQLKLGDGDWQDGGIHPQARRLIF